MTHEKETFSCFVKCGAYGWHLYAGLCEHRLKRQRTSV